MRISDWSSDVCSSDLQHQSGHSGFGAPQPFAGQGQWDRTGGAGKQSVNDNRLTWAIAGLAALILIVGVVAIVALNMGDKKGQSSPDGVTNAADAPTSASTDDFCPAFEKVPDASVHFQPAT